MVYASCASPVLKYFLVSVKNMSSSFAENGDRGVFVVVIKCAAFVCSRRREKALSHTAGSSTEVLL